MNRPTCYYIVKARTAFKNNQTNEIEFKAIEKKFENENPILARESAFIFRDEFLYGILSFAIGLNDEEIGWNPSERRIKKLSDREIRKLINSYLEPDNKSPKTIMNIDDEEKEVEWQAPDDTLAWYPNFNNGVWIIMKHNDPELSSDGDIVIDKISRYEKPLPTPPNYYNLKTEYQFYKAHDYETKSYETSTVFFDDEMFLDGEADEEEALVSFDYLETPFDWTDYDRIFWWKKEIDIVTEDLNVQKEKTLLITMEEALIEGEYQFCEFKPSLINRPFEKRNMEYENARAICAFLNAHGGYLFIGVDDNGKPIGLDFSHISKDLFRREFTRIKTRFLPSFIAHRIYGDFYSFEDKEIFVVTVYPSEYDPIFLRKKDESNKLINKEFYVRSDAASRHIYDIEEIAKYCRDHWKL